MKKLKTPPKEIRASVSFSFNLSTVKAMQTFVKKNKINASRLMEVAVIKELNKYRPKTKKKERVKVKGFQTQQKQTEQLTLA